MAPKKDDNQGLKSLRAGMSLISIGMLLGISTAIGFFFGSWLDERLHTQPWFMLIFTLLGIAAGFIEMIKMISEASKED